MFEGERAPPFYMDLYNFKDGAQNDIFIDSYAELPTPTPNNTIIPALLPHDNNSSSSSPASSEGNNTSPNPNNNDQPPGRPHTSIWCVDFVTYILRKTDLSPAV